MHYFYRPQTKLREGYVFTAVCDSIHGGGGVCLSACWDATPTPGADTPLPAQCMLGDTVNKWAVCILLECNLVFLCNQIQQLVIFKKKIESSQAALSPNIFIEVRFYKRALDLLGLP